jgi:phospholipid-translocating ATPase
VLILAACILFEIGVRAWKGAFFPTDVEVFQQLEKDAEVRKRLEEASASELQAGWSYDKTKTASLNTSNDIHEQEKREGEVQDLLDRPRVMEEGRSMRSHSKGDVRVEEQRVMIDDEVPTRRSTDVHELLSRRFGSIRAGGASVS